MIKTTCLTLAMLMLSGVSMAQAKAPATKPVTSLDNRYINWPHRFSVCPPKGLIRGNQASAELLVEWQRRDEKSNAIAFSLGFLRPAATLSDGDVKENADKLKAQLSQFSAVKLEDMTMTRIGGAEGFSLTVTRATAGKNKLWQREVWLLRDQGQFLVFQIQGPASDAAALKQISDDVLGSLELISAKQVTERREKNLAAGKKFLAGLKADAIRKAANMPPRYCLLSQESQAAGYLYMNIGWANESGIDGVKIDGFIVNTQVRVDMTALASADRQAETWRHVGASVDKGQTYYDERGTLDKGRFNVISKVDDKEHKLNKSLPADMKDVYLPRAMVLMLPHLVRLDKPSSCAFATYNSQANAFDVLTVTVVGKEKISVGGKDVQSVRVEIQPAEDAVGDVLWLTPDGTLLRSSSPSMSMDVVTREALLKKFPKAMEAR